MQSAGTAVSFRLITLTVAVVFGLLGPVRAQAENLADAMVGAYNTSGLLEQQRAVLRAADEGVAGAVSRLRPVINWTIDFGRDLVNSRTAGISTDRNATTLFTGLTLEQLIYDGGATRLSVEASKETVLATRQSLLSVEQQILFRAAQAYLNVILAEENVGVRQNNVRVLGEELRAAQDRFDVGEVTRTDVALAESRLAAARSNLVTAQGALGNARAEYINAVGRAPGRLAGRPALPSRPASLEAAQALALRNHPEVLSAQHQVTAAELNVQRVQKALGPTASLRADAGIADNVDNSNYNHDLGLGITFRQPIYQGGRLAADLRREMANRDATRSNLLNVQRDIAQAVNNAWVRLQAASASLGASNERVRAAQVAFDGIREEATLGARTTLDVLTAEQELLDAKTSLITDETEQSIAAYQLLVSQGLLTAERLALGVQIYDPTVYYNLVKGAPAKVSRQSRDLDRVLEALGKR